MYLCICAPHGRTMNQKIRWTVIVMFTHHQRAGKFLMYKVTSLGQHIIVHGNTSCGEAKGKNNLFTSQWHLIKSCFLKTDNHSKYIIRLAEAVCLIFY